MKKNLLLIILSCFVALGVSAQSKNWKKVLRTNKAEFFTTDEARRIGDQLILYQRVTGGWAKNVDVVRPLTDDEKVKIQQEKSRTDDSTTDNGSTSMQMVFLARLYQGTKDPRYKEAFSRAVDYLLSGQYANGGWPQFWPNPKGYQVHITYNDDAMIHTLELFQQMANEQEPYQGNLVDGKQRKRMKEAFNKGIECILRTQIVVDGKPTVWCQQHDRETYKPAKARAYELPSYCSAESAPIVRLLMTLPNPDDRIKKAVHGAMAWFDKYKITGYRIDNFLSFDPISIKIAASKGKVVNEDEDDPDSKIGAPDIRLVEDPAAAPIWARYYDLENNEPYVCDRDGLPRRKLEDIGYERRTGYSWFGSHATKLYDLYNEWADKYDPANKLDLTLNSPGANETGKIHLFRKSKIKESNFDVIVKRGESIQAAIDNAPLDTTGNKPYKILVKKGIYHEKVIIDKPNIVLVGENRDSCIIVGAEIAEALIKSEYNGKKVHQGIVVLTDNANDCIISGMTIINNYGSTVNPTTTHQMAVYGTATRTIIINSNIISDGNDALSLWAKKGMYYHADLYIRCPGVDFICPRGTCFATRCHFYGDGRAMIWHDGHNNPKEKFVITNSYFDGRKPTVLGRFHHDAQFFLVNCHLSENIIDKDIEHAYANRKPEEVGKEIDPCPFGRRIYYYGTYRNGGDKGWLRDNLNEAEGSPDAGRMTSSKWTFSSKWDPEERISSLWNILEY